METNGAIAGFEPNHPKIIKVKTKSQKRT